MSEKTINTETVFEGKLLRLEVQDVEFDDGKRATREIVRHPGCTATVARLPDGRFAFVRQYRKAVDLEMLEIVAGVLEEGESPDECAAREIREETGHDPVNLVKLGAVYPTPGYNDEELHLYFAELSATRGATAPDDDEHVELVYLERDRVEQMMANGEIHDAKTLAAFLLYEKKCGSLKLEGRWIE